MTSIADKSVIIQTSSHSVPCPPPWFGEVALLVSYLRKQGVLAAINERVRFARRRAGHYEVIDFLAVLFGYAVSGERTLEAFYERLSPFASTFMALVDRDRLPARSTLSRFLAALTGSGSGSFALPGSRGSACASPGQGAADRRPGGSRGLRAGGVRHRWYARGRPPTGPAQEPRAA